jgi:hypothetical protein
VADSRAARVARWGLGAFVGIVVAEHALRPGLAPGQHFVSEYGVGSTAPLQSAAFVAWSASMAAAALLSPPPPAPRRPLARAVVAGALAVAALGALACAAFATQTVAGRLPDGVARTTAGRLHDLGTLLILAGLLVAALAGVRLIGRRRHTLEVAGLAVALVAVVPVLVALGIDAPGWGQRAFILVGCLWQWRFVAACRG